jgi:hypothetical protein
MVLDLKRTVKKLFNPQKRKSIISRGICWEFVELMIKIEVMSKAHGVYAKTNVDS